MATNVARDGWSSGPWDFCADPGICCKTCFCICCTHGEVQEQIRGTPCFLSCCIMYWLPPLAALCEHVPARSLMRRTFNLPEEPCGDCCFGCCCLGCSMCQMQRELQARRVFGHQQFLQCASRSPSIAYAQAPPPVQVMSPPPQAMGVPAGYYASAPPAGYPEPPKV